MRCCPIAASRTAAARGFTSDTSAAGLVELGHHVEVFSGQPYPEELDPRVVLTEVPSLDMYREPDPFRIPHPREIRDRIDLLELAGVWTAGFPEPRTFSLRAARLLADRLDDFDVVHDNQSLGVGLLTIADDRHARGRDRAPPDHPRPGAGSRRRTVVA